MVISSTLTTQLENVHAPIPLSRTRPRSVPVYTSRVTANTPTEPQPVQKRRPRQKIFYIYKPPFINFASPYVNPYRSLTPIPVNIDYRRYYRSKSVASARKSKADLSTDDIIESNQTNEHDIPIDENTISTRFAVNHQYIDISPLHPDAFDREFCQKRQSIIDDLSYREKIDTWKATSLNHLTTLIEELTSDNEVLERTWIIYYWLSQNIRYDIDADFTSNNRHQKAEEVFRTGKSTCEGYASIFKNLCDSLQIPCMKILGYVKDYSFKISHSKFSQVNHTWNAVQLNNNYWYLIDSAWGTGYIDGNHEYKKDLKPHYFLTHPEHMIYNHLPEESQWQLLTKPITMEDYMRLPHVHSYYFIFGLSIISPRFSSIVSFDKNQSYAEVLIHAPDDIQLTCAFKDDNRSTTLTQYDYSRQVWQCLFSPYKSGFHTLIIFANQRSTINLLKNVLELGVYVSSRDLTKGKTLPITFGKFTEYKCQILSPLNGIVKRGTKVTIRCRIPDAISARISLDGIWFDEIKLKNDYFKQQINVPEREVILYAQFSDNKKTNTYDGLIRYIVEK